ncbi:nucleolar protein 16-like [Orbicella faveolata]|uniref:nucleolar protein 16-like n=1 Tax=Orbicella faveolata TaxID=48498 RepID=UPI0009E49C40|nr:nucleolar protein 16-like [Orbicella faveolata]
MTGVRRKKTQRKKRVNTTKPGLKRKKREKKVKVLNQTLRQNWDQKKTLKQNLQNLGLAFDANAAVPIPKRKVKGHNTEEVEEMEVDREPTAVVKEFEKMAANELKGERHISPGEAQFLWQLIQDHGNNYKGMARDKRNCYQHTPNQLRRKCEAFLRSTQDFSGYLETVG